MQNPTNPSSPAAGPTAPSPDPPDPPLSWCERVTGVRKVTHAPLAQGSLWKAGKIKVSFPDGVDGSPHVAIDREVMNSLYKAWSNSVILKVLGRPVSHAVMDRRVRQMWNLKGRMTLMDIPNGYFVARFELEDDFLYVLTEGPWMIFGNYIVVRQWDPLFRPDSDVIHSTYAWIRLTGLDMVLYEENVLFGIASAIGNPIRVDLNTLMAARGRFARICVEIDITQPLFGSIIVNGEKVFIEYEGLNTICYRCGRYGHLVDKCQQKEPEMEPRNCENEQVTAGQNSLTPASTSRGPTSAAKRDIGAWSVVGRRNYRKSNGKNDTTKIAAGIAKSFSHNRFDSLNVENIDMPSKEGMEIEEDTGIEENRDPNIIILKGKAFGDSNGKSQQLSSGPGELNLLVGPQSAEGKDKRPRGGGKRAKTDGASNNYMGRVEISTHKSPPTTLEAGKKLNENQILSGKTSMSSAKGSECLPPMQQSVVENAMNGLSQPRTGYSMESHQLEPPGPGDGGVGRKYVDLDALGADVDMRMATEGRNPLGQLPGN
ncbi:hypothetical protein V2J09_007652 [Rumex salicifolius]